MNEEMTNNSNTNTDAINNLESVNSNSQEALTNVEISNENTNVLNSSTMSDVSNENVPLENPPIENQNIVIEEVVKDISASENNNTLETPSQDTTTVQKIEESSYKEKKKSKLPLLLLLLVLAVGIFIGVFFFIKSKTTTQNIYYKTVREFSNKLITTLDSSSPQLKDIYGATINGTINASDYGGLTSLVDTLNKIKVNEDFEIDYKNKKLYLSLDTLYDTDSMLKGELLAKDNTMYLNLPDLYSKPIKLVEGETIEEIFTVSDYTNDYKTIIQELSEILIASLKDEWFTTSKEKIDVLGSSVKTTVHTLKLDSTRIFELEKSLLFGVHQNDRLLTSIHNVTGKDKEKLKQTLIDKRENLEKPETNETIEISIYVNRSNELQKIIIKSIEDQEENILDLSLTDVDTYDILLNKEKLATLIFKENNIEFSFKNETTEMSIVMKIQKDNLNVIAKMESDGTNLELNIVDDNKKFNAKVLVSVPESSIDVAYNILMELKDVSEVKEFSTDDYVELEELTEDDLNSILQKIENNPALISLITDVKSVGFLDMIKSDI